MSTAATVAGCAFCGIPFVAARASQVYCREACKRYAWSFQQGIIPFWGAGRGVDRDTDLMHHLRAEIPPPDWTQAACRGSDLRVFYPERGEPAGPAKKICADCPIRQACGDYAVETGELYGVWGGLSAHQRRPLRLAKRAAA